MESEWKGECYKCGPCVLFKSILRAYCLVWCGMALYGIEGYCMVLYCISWYCMVFYCMVLYGIILYSIILYGILLYCILWYYMYGMAYIVKCDAMGYDVPSYGVS